MQVDKLEPKPDPVRSWLTWPVVDKRPKVREIGCHKNGDSSSITIGNLTPKELEALQQFIFGTSYICCQGGRVHAWHAFEDLPPPQRDPILSECWNPPPDGETKVGGMPKGKGIHSPGLVIRSAGACYGSDSKEPQRSYQLLESFGFVCMRSPRGDDGRYWEQWVLHGLWQAKGQLGDWYQRWRADNKDASDFGPKWFECAEEACKFINSQGVRYGSLDIVIQRWYFASPD